MNSGRPETGGRETGGGSGRKLMRECRTGIVMKRENGRICGSVGNAFFLLPFG
jgi:hypothetical protein